MAVNSFPSVDGMVSVNSSPSGGGMLERNVSVLSFCIAALEDSSPFMLLDDMLAVEKSVFASVLVADDDGSLSVVGTVTFDSFSLTVGVVGADRLLFGSGTLVVNVS